MGLVYACLPMSLYSIPLFWIEEQIEKDGLFHDILCSVICIAISFTVAYGCFYYYTHVLLKL